MNNGMIVEISNRQAKHSFQESLLQQVVSMIVSDAGFSSAEISVSIVDDAEIHRHNVEYLDHDYPTDVLSFPLDRQDEFLAGEIIVSADTADQQSREQGVTTESELTLYVIHGALHLVGYNDKTEPDKQVMRKKEAYYLNRVDMDQTRVDMRPTNGN